MGAEIVPYEKQDDDLPRAMQDAQTLRLLSPDPQVQVDAIEKGVRLHPNGVEEHYQRVEFR